MSRELKLLSVVAPMYNEEATAAAFCERSLRGAGRASRSSSSSSTTASTRRHGEDRSTTLAARDPRVRVVRLSRNFGHQTAITAGLDHARGDAVVMIDADLQDPPEVIPELSSHWREGADVVYAVRAATRGRDALQAGDRALVLPPDVARWRSVDLAPDAGDFRLMDRSALDAPARHARAQPLPARHDRLGRLHARPRCPTSATRATRARRSTRCAACCASRSTRSPRSRTCRSSWRRCSGFLFSLHRVPRASRSSIALQLAGSFVPGVTTILIVVLLLGGIQLITVGIIGEYVGRIYDEVKRRPLYLVRERRNLRETTVDDAEPLARTPRAA